MDQTQSGLNGGSANRSVAGRDDDLSVIREQTRETVALLRQLIEMLLPRGEPDAPKLEDLIAALVMQQQETLRVVKQVAADLAALLDRDGGRPAPRIPSG